MTPALAAAQPVGNLHRVPRGADAWAWPPWAYAGEDGTFGNRFDDPAGEYRVLDASAPRVGAFLETLARYGTDPVLVAECAEIAIEPEDAERNIDLSVILEAADRCIDEIEAPAEAKAEAGGVLRRMREAGTAVATTVGGEVLAAAVRRSLGVP